MRPLLAETGLGGWLIFVRETDLHPDPGFELVVGSGVVRNSACLFGTGGERIAIAAHFDTADIRKDGVFGEVIGYDEDVRGPLLDALRRLDPPTIGLNYSLDDLTADGLTHGQYLLLLDLLRGTTYADRGGRAYRPRGPGNPARSSTSVPNLSRATLRGKHRPRYWLAFSPSALEHATRACQ